jgi:threonine dehydrogenase-like Zn-dependent dehydrogenase
VRATLIYGAGDVRVESVPDPVLREPTDAVVRVPRSCICGSDLWPYAAREHTEHGDRIGAPQYVNVRMDAALFMRNVTLTGGVAPARAYIEELLPDVLDGTVESGRVFDRTVGLDEVPDGYRAMAAREALKVLIRP